MSRFPISCLAVLAAAVSFSSQALSHPRLVAASPLANTAAVKPNKISLTFSEILVAPLSGIELIMTSMPGMPNSPMPIRGFKTVVKGKSMTVTMPRALTTGTYLLKWHAVAADQHRVEDSYSFTVR
ncbi:MAG: copper resistance protein CopC [Sphingomicrobium sp.]